MGDSSKVEKRGILVLKFVCEALLEESLNDQVWEEKRRSWRTRAWITSQEVLPRVGLNREGLFAVLKGGGAGEGGRQ